MMAFENRSGQKFQDYALGSGSGAVWREQRNELADARGEAEGGDGEGKEAGLRGDRRRRP